MFTGEITVRQEHLDEVIQAANFFQIQGVQEWNIRCCSTTDMETETTTTTKTNTTTSSPSLKSSKGNFKKRMLESSQQNFSDHHQTIDSKNM